MGDSSGGRQQLAWSTLVYRSTLSEEVLFYSESLWKHSENLTKATFVATLLSPSDYKQSVAHRLRLKASHRRTTCTSAAKTANDSDVPSSFFSGPRLPLC